MTHGTIIQSADGERRTFIVVVVVVALVVVVIHEVVLFNPLNTELNPICQ